MCVRVCACHRFAFPFEFRLLHSLSFFQARTHFRILYFFPVISLSNTNHSRHSHEAAEAAHISIHTYQVVFWAFRYQKVVNLLARFDIYDFILSKRNADVYCDETQCMSNANENEHFVFFLSRVCMRCCQMRKFATFTDKFNDNMDMLIIHEI